MEFFRQLLAAFVHDPQSAYPLVFNSRIFVVFFLVLYILQVATLTLQPLRVYVLLAFNLLFFYKFNGWFVLLLAGSALIDFMVGLTISSTRNTIQRGILLSLSLLTNIGFLIYFKYTSFIIAAFVQLTNSPSEWTLPVILAPIGISYFSFKSLSYVFDCYYEIIEEPTSNYFEYLAYVSFFPALLAGPIHRAEAFLEELRKSLTLTRGQVNRAILLFISGLAMKVVLADFLALNYVNRIFDAPDQYSGIELLMAAYTYGVQLFCDFSGYTNMALGVALLLGFELKPNFNQPFRATNVSDFWRRWHISLSSWFQDYVFTPLNFAWRSWKAIGAIAAALLTFWLSGLWHGAGWTFILWGTLQGIGVSWDVATAKVRKRLRGFIPASIYVFVSWLLTFHFLMFSFVIFRVKDLATAELFLQRLVEQMQVNQLIDWFVAYPTIAIATFAGLTLHFMPVSWKDAVIATVERWHWTVVSLCVVLAVVLIYQAQSAESLPFVYLAF
jgi:alginate O-acetyltransferase complex protein AlgI